MTEGLAAAVWQMQQADQPRLAFYKGANGRLLFFPDDQVSLPVAGLAAILVAGTVAGEWFALAVRNGGGGDRCAAVLDGGPGRCVEAIGGAVPMVMDA